MSSSFDTSAQGKGPWSERGCGGAYGWKPLEIAAMVVGFAVWWPIGLAVLGFKIAQKRGYAVPDVFGAASDRLGAFGRNWNAADRKTWRPFADPGSSGNAAFDDWRKAELARLEEERRKVEAAEREFTDHMANLRRARDREEFDRFMATRSNPSQG